MNDFSMDHEPIADIVRSSYAVGKTIDISTIGYGRVHWGNRKDVLDTPVPYYYLLAGMVRRHKLNRIFEIGTHWGGATRAMYLGMDNPAAGKVVTVDITTESDNRLHAYPDITKIVGEGNTEPVYDKVMEAFGGQPIDIMYIDADHAMMPTVISYSIYVAALKPRFVVLDDVTWNEGMRKAWKVIQQSVAPDDSINAFDVDPSIRPSPDRPGFGVVRTSKLFRRAAQ